MHMRLWLSLGMLVAGASLLVATNLASAGGHGPPLKNGGVFRVGLVGPSAVIDPQVAANPTAWWLEYATSAKLYNYPDRAGAAGMKLVPEVASRFAVSRSGKSYAFTIRKGFKFSDGKPVTATSFKYAINRVANHDLGSLGAQFITDPAGTNIVGARAVNAGKTKAVSGVLVKGNRLIVNLTRADPTFMAKITMPYFQATSSRLPLDKRVVEVSSIRDMPTAGPYVFSRNDVNTLTSIRQNPYWKAGPGRNRPRHLAGVDVQWNLAQNTAFLQMMANELDLAIPVPPGQIPGLAKQFGVNKTRFWTKPANGTGWLVLNTSRPLFHNVKLRKALNYAVSRKDYTNLGGPYSGQPWSHILNPGVPGWSNVQPYPLRAPNLAKARKLAGPLGDKKINVWYISSGYDPVGPERAQIVRRDLIRLGFRSENISMKGFPGLQIFNAMSIRGNQADLGVSMGWLPDYPDPYDWINIPFSGKSIGEENNINMSYFQSAKWDRRMEKASKLTGAARLEAYGKLDIDLMREAAPVVPMQTFNTVYMFSKRVDPRSLVYQGVYTNWSIPALALK